LTAASNGTTPAPVGATYVCISTDATLTDERVLTAGTGLSLTDGGAGSTATLAINSTVLTTTGNQTITGNKTITPSSNGTAFYITNAAASRSVFTADTTNVRIGIGTGSPSATCHIRNTSTTALELLYLDQQDIDESFINFVGTSATDFTRSLSSATSGVSLNGYIKIEINGTAKWIPYYV
jgi:hypothetical protein